MEMTNFNNAELVELNSVELLEVEAGYWFLIGLGLAILNTDWDKAGSDFKRGFNS